MTARQLYEAVLIELNKENAPNIMLDDFNYFINKAVLQYINKRYNIYDINQQTTDDLRVLKATAILDVIKTPYNKKIGGISQEQLDNLFMFMGATYTAELPQDYYHLLNCMCFYKVNNTYSCYDAGTVARAAATRLTADSWSQVVDNYWNRPTYKHPYYYIHNVNILTEVPTNPNFSEKKIYDSLTNKYLNLEKVEELSTSGNSSKEEKLHYRLLLLKFDEEALPANMGTDKDDVSNKTKKEGINNDENGSLKSEYLEDAAKDDPFKSIDISGFINNKGSWVDGNFKYYDTSYKNKKYPQKSALVRYGNASKVLLEIRYGEDTSTFELFKVMVDYIKAPQHIRLTQEQIDRTLDYSQVLEFPDYVCQEIVNELVTIIMENISDLRLQTHPVVSLSIANPAQQLTPDAATSAK